MEARSQTRPDRLDERRDEQTALRVVRDSPDGTLTKPYDGPTYYDQPTLKQPHYKWLIVNYFFVGGIAGGAQVLAAVADLAGNEEDRVVVRHGRYLALAGGIVSPVLLIADLYKPSRFLNMLRIFRRTSAMSIGSWTLAAFGTLSGLTAVCQFLEDRGNQRRWRRWGRVVQGPAAATGGLMACYTGTLLSTTSVPFWAAVPVHLPIVFGTSAAATASAALTLSLKWAGAAGPVVRRLEHVKTVAAGAEVAAHAAIRQKWRRERVDSPLRQEPLRTAYWAGAVGAGVAVPLAIAGFQKLTGRRSTTATIAAATATLVGGFLLRAVVTFGGRSSVKDPRDYFQMTQPDRHEPLESTFAPPRRP
jgi:formate-dependent nitrite reductase membrane component NrfD